ncbi:MAG: aromatic acid decarboxylase [Spirochaetae bacterium HGW-Spirochaetae-3]|jgi:4-hydroxy-3-polyprenylbenzoate decarboxylase|nr:MAG: aromatic acid decarboxylase [Spirochaetae bacterium HGW-Spirochaetae-3]
MGRFLVCVTGASGSVYGKRTIEALLAAGHEVHAVFSTWGRRVFETETGLDVESWLDGIGFPAGRLYAPDDLASRPSSGSWRLDGTVVVPCSMSTVGAIASGATTNLVHRAAAVALKEGRRLVLAPRETPLSLVDLRNLTRLAEAGAAILPASPGFYHKPASIDDLVDFVAGKILDRLGADSGGGSDGLFERWDGDPSGRPAPRNA